MNYLILEILAEKGVSLDGKPLVNELGILRYQQVDWEKSNKIVKDEILDRLCNIKV